MPRTRTSRVYLKGSRFYGDFRDLNGKLEALKEPGSTVATSDPDVAAALAAARVKELESIKRGLAIVGTGAVTMFARYCAHHLKEKVKHGEVTAGTIAEQQVHLERAIAFFCNGGRPLPRNPGTGDAILTNIKDRALTSIKVKDVKDWADWLRTTYKGRRGNDVLSPGAIRHNINSLSSVFARAIEDEKVPVGYNPVASWAKKPKGKPGEARWLEPHECALILEAAKTYAHETAREDQAIPDLHALLATSLLTGGRPAEIYGLTVDDVSFARSTVTFRPNQFRRLKTLGSARVVPLWPQLEEILREYLAGANAPKGKLLFPSKHRRLRGGDEAMLGDIRRALDVVAVKAGWAEGEIRPYSFRHSYTAARLQTTDHGAPVSPFQISRELGHGGTSLVERVYGHLGTVRHRGEVVEFRKEVVAKIEDVKERERFEKRFEAVERHLRLVA